MAALQDTNVFVLRTALDILAGHFRLDRGLFSETRLTRLVAAAMAIIIKKYPPNILLSFSYFIIMIHFDIFILFIGLF